MAVERTVTVESLPFSVLEAGEGGRPLLLVHGFTGAKEDFADHLDAFADGGWWVVAPDLRGHGASPKPDGEADYSLEIMATDVLGLADVLGWDRFALLGHSMGGMVVQELVLRTPHRVGRLILMDTSHGTVEGLDPAVVDAGIDVIRTQGLHVLLDFLDAVPPQRAPSDQRVHDTRPGYKEFGDRKVRGVAPAMYAAMADSLVRRPDRLAELASLSVPTHVVVGAEDASFLAPSRRMADTIAGATLDVIPDAAHSPQFEHPEAWWVSVSSFLAAEVSETDLV